MNTEIFNYNGNNITFQLASGDVMVNATQMAKPFNKKPAEYLRLPSTLEYLKVKVGLSHLEKNDLVRTIQGGKNSGTWMHEDIALDFAQWLNIEFKIWCNDRLKELLKTGSTQIDFSDANAVVKLAQNYANEQNKRLQAEKQVKLLTPKAELMDKVLDAEEKIDIGQASKILELPFGRNTMFKKLREKGIFFKNRNEPKQEYIKRQYFVLKEKYITRNSHDGFVVVKVLVTQKGLEFLSNLFNTIESSKKLAVMQ